MVHSATVILSGTLIHSFSSLLSGYLIRLYWCSRGAWFILLQRYSSGMWFILVPCYGLWMWLASSYTIFIVSKSRQRQASFSRSFYGDDSVVWSPDHVYASYSWHIVGWYRFVSLKTCVYSWERDRWRSRWPSALTWSICRTLASFILHFLHRFPRSL